MTLASSSPLNESFQLKCSETSIMETFNRALYHFSKTNDISILQECAKDISGIMDQSLNYINIPYPNYTKRYASFIGKNIKYITGALQRDICFDTSGHYFSIAQVPRIDFKMFNDLMDDYVSFSESVFQVISGRDIDLKFRDSMYDDDYTRSILIGKILGVNKSVAISDFVQHVKRSYRSGEISPKTIQIDDTYMSQHVLDYTKVVQDFNNTELDLKNLNSLFMKMVDLINVTRTKCLSISEDSPEKLELCFDALNYKYSQAVFFENVYRTILMERIKALNDLMLQNVEVCNQYLKLFKMSVSGVRENILTNPNVEITDYVEVALEDMILSQIEYMTIMESRYTEEIKFVSECMHSGAVSQVVMELTLSGIYQALKDNFIKFIDKIIAIVRGKQLKYSQKYVPWLNDVGEETIVAKAKNMKSVTMAPYFDGNELSKDLRDIQSAITEVPRNTDKNNLSFTKRFVDNMDTQEKYENERGNLSGYLKNYFRFNKKNVKAVEKVDISGKDLASKIPTMFKYILQYEKSVKALDGLKRTLETTIQNLANSKVMDSFTYLQLEDCPASHTDLVLLEGYQLLLEETDTSKKDETVGKVVNDKGEVESPTKVETSEQKEKKEAKEKGETPVPSSKYTKIFQNFFQLAISAYITAMEERYISYVNVLCQLAGERPKVDDNGKYVPKEEKKEEPVKDSTLPTTFYNKPPELKGLKLYQ